MRFVKPVFWGLAMTPYVWVIVLAPFVGWWALLALAVVPWLVALAMVFATWDKTGSPDSNGQHPEVRRGDLPDWASFLATPDERLPGGTYEPTVWAVFECWGPGVCGMYWLGWRNQLHGLAFKLAVPLLEPWTVEPGYWTQGTSGALWWLRWPIPLTGNYLQLKAGYRQYLIKGTLYGVPCCTITRA